MKNVLEAVIKNKKDITSLLPDSDTRTGEGKKKKNQPSLERAVEGQPP